MTKVVILVSRRAGMDQATFSRYWREVHAPIAAQMPGIRRYVQNHVVPDPAAEDSVCDGLVELWFDDAAAMQAAFNSPEGQLTFADVPNFLDPDKVRVLVVEEHTIG